MLPARRRLPSKRSLLELELAIWDGWWGSGEGRECRNASGIHTVCVEKTMSRKRFLYEETMNDPSNMTSSSCVFFSFFLLTSSTLYSTSPFQFLAFFLMRTPVSRILDKYLHEFRATARKLEEERGEGMLWNSLGPSPDWPLGLRCPLPCHPSITLHTSALLFSSRFSFGLEKSLGSRPMPEN